MEEGVDAVRNLRMEVEFLRGQVNALLHREHERDIVNALMTGGTAVAYGRRCTDRPALWVVPSTG